MSRVGWHPVAQQRPGEPIDIAVSDVPQVGHHGWRTYSSSMGSWMHVS